MTVSLLAFPCLIAASNTYINHINREASRINRESVSDRRPEGVYKGQTAVTKAIAVDILLVDANHGLSYPASTLEQSQGEG
jgi:hypothetical protein